MLASDVNFLVKLLPIAALALLVASGIYAYLTYYFSYWRKRGVEGPVPRLLVGTFPKTSAGQLYIIEELHEIYERFKDKQQFVGVFAARYPKLFILNPKLAHDVLTTHFKHFHDNEASRWTSPRVEQMRLCSPFVSTGENWRQRRAELTPTVTLNRLRGQHTTLQRAAKQLVKYVGDRSASGQTLDAKELANRFTVHFSAQFIWNIEENSLDAAYEANRLSIYGMAADMVAQAARCVTYYARTAGWPFVRVFRPVPFFTAANERFFQRLTQSSLSAHRAEATRTHADVMNYLLQLKEKKGLGDEVLAGHTTTMLIDAYETGAVLIAHCLLLLARSERVQAKLRQELKDAGGVWALDHDTLNEQPYLDQCVQETLRIFPPLPTLFKLCTEDFTLPFNDGTERELQLRAGDTVYISSYSFHHDEAYFEQPETFRPERFDAEEGGVRRFRDAGVFLPFGAGPRMCPGVRLGLAEAKYMVAAIVSHFHIASGPTTRSDNKLDAGSYLLTIADGIELKFEEIH